MLCFYFQANNTLDHFIVTAEFPYKVTSYVMKKTVQRCTIRNDVYKELRKKMNTVNNLMT